MLLTNVFSSKLSAASGPSVAKLAAVTAPAARPAPPIHTQAEAVVDLAEAEEQPPEPRKSQRSAKQTDLSAFFTGKAIDAALESAAPKPVLASASGSSAVGDKRKRSLASSTPVIEGTTGSTNGSKLFSKGKWTGTLTPLKLADVQVGCAVYARYDGKQYFYPAAVVSVDGNCRDGVTYDVKYTDGIVETLTLRALKKFTPAPSGSGVNGKELEVQLAHATGSASLPVSGSASVAEEAYTDSDNDDGSLTCRQEGNSETKAATTSQILARSKLLLRPAASADDKLSCVWPAFIKAVDSVTNLTKVSCRGCGDDIGSGAINTTNMKSHLVNKKALGLSGIKGCIPGQDLIAETERGRDWLRTVCGIEIKVVPLRLGGNTTGQIPLATTSSSGGVGPGMRSYYHASVKSTKEMSKHDIANCVNSMLIEGTLYVSGVESLHFQ
jgi:hypothetical protein